MLVDELNKASMNFQTFQDEAKKVHVEMKETNGQLAQQISMTFESIRKLNVELNELKQN